MNNLGLIQKFKSLIKWRSKNLVIHILRLIYELKKHDHYSNIIIFGSGRSGTTFLSEVLESLNKAKLIDEPLKNSNSHKIDKIGFTGWGQFIPENEFKWKDAFHFFDRLLSGKEFNPNHIRNLSNIFTTKIYVLKFIRGNMLMPWLIRNFQIRKPIYLIRNPYAVIASQLRHSGWNSNEPLKFKNGIIIPKFKYYNQFYNKYEIMFNEVRQLEEHLTLLWIMENEYIINHPMHNKEWIAISYEELILKPAQTLEKLGSLIDFPVTEKMKNLVNTPSYSSQKDEIEVSVQLNGWKNYLSDNQVESIEKMLNRSSIKGIYKADDLLPQF